MPQKYNSMGPLPRMGWVEAAASSPGEIGKGGGLRVEMPSLAYEYHVVRFSSYEMTIARCHELQYGCTNAKMYNIIVVIRWCHELAMTLVDLFVYFDRNH